MNPLVFFASVALLALAFYFIAYLVKLGRYKKVTPLRSFDNRMVAGEEATGEPKAKPALSTAKPVKFKPVEEPVLEHNGSWVFSQSRNGYLRASSRGSSYYSQTHYYFKPLEEFTDEQKAVSISYLDQEYTFAWAVELITILSSKGGLYERETNSLFGEISGNIVNLHETMKKLNASTPLAEVRAFLWNERVLLHYMREGRAHFFKAISIEDPAFNNGLMVLKGDLDADDS